MNVHILQTATKHNGRSNKDTNGGFGTVNDFGKGLVPAFLKTFKNQTMNYPELLPAYVRAILTAQGHNVTYAVNDVPLSSEVVLIQSSIIDVQEEIFWAKKLKSENPAIRVGFMGGMSSANAYLYKEQADFCIVGEIENALLRNEITNLKGVVEAGLVKNLDEIPFPDWTHLPVQNRKYRVFRKTSGITIPVLTSRGCPMPCSYYCTYPLVQGSTFRARSNENVLDEIHSLIDQFNHVNILFRDPIFSLDMKRIESLCEGILNRSLKFTWICETHPKFLDEALIKLMARAGCVAIKLGIESGDMNVMKKSHRKSDQLEHQEAVIRACEASHIHVLAFYILGYFDDTKQTVEQTIRYALYLNTYGAQFTIATPYPGTEWYASLQAENDMYQLDPSFENYNQYQLVYQHPNVSKKELENYKSQAYHRYYMRWSYIRKNLFP